MARPQKKTLEFISIDTVDKNTLKRLQRRFGSEGRLFWYELLRLIGRTENYVVDLLNDLDIEDVIESELFVKKDRGIEILNNLSEWGNIDAELWINFRLIWCQNLIDRHDDLWKKRQSKPERPRVSVAEMVVSGAETIVSGAETGVSGAISTQRKVKESKENKKKENKEKVLTSKTRFSPPLFLELQAYFFEKIQDEKKSSREAQKFLNFYESKNWFVGKNKMTSWKSAVSGWVSRSMDDERNNSLKNETKMTGTQELLNQFPHLKNQVYESVINH